MLGMLNILDSPLWQELSRADKFDLAKWAVDETQKHMRVSQAAGMAYVMNQTPAAKRRWEALSAVSDSFLDMTTQLCSRIHQDAEQGQQGTVLS